MTTRDFTGFFDKLVQAMSKRNGLFGFLEDMGFMNVKKIQSIAV